MADISLPPYKKHGEFQPIAGIQGTEAPEYQWDKVIMDTHIIHGLGYTGKGVKIGILDTGIRKGDHPDLKVSEVKAFKSFIPGETAIDGNGHGTAVHSVISSKHNSMGMVGAAPDAEIYIAKVLSNSGSGSVQSLIDGTNWLMDQGVNIMNGSLGFGNKNVIVSYNKVMEAAVKRGVTLVFASGNGGKNSEIDFPSSADKSFGIGAIDARLRIASFSNKSPSVDGVAAGVNVMVASNTHDGFVGMSGTSFASPNYAGMLACYFQWYKELNGKFPTFQEAYFDITKNHSFDLGLKGFDPSYGYGLIRPKIAEKPEEGQCPEPTYEKAVEVVGSNLNGLAKAIFDIIT